MKEIIVKNIRYKELDNSMPTPMKWLKGFGGMSIIDSDTEDVLMNCFLSGTPYEVYTACEDVCIVEYGGKTTLHYFVNKDSMEEYEATEETYEKFIKYLKNKFKKAKIIVI